MSTAVHGSYVDLSAFLPSIDVPMQVKLKIVESTVKHGSVLEERGPLAWFMIGHGGGDESFSLDVFSAADMQRLTDVALDAGDPRTGDRPMFFNCYTLRW